MPLGSAKTLKFKVFLFFIAVSVSLIVVLTTITFFAFRQFAISTATEHVRTAAEIVRVHLTESMIAGTIDQRQTFLLRLAELQNLKASHVVRSPILEEQYGEGRKGGYVPDEIEKTVFKTGKPSFKITESKGEMIFRGTIPYIANQEGGSNCLQCHIANTGDVLGAVTMSMPITSLRHDTIVTVAGIAGAVTVAVVVLFVLLFYLLKPISNTAGDIERAVQDAIDGNFKNEIKKQTNDEIGQIANDMNRLLKFLNGGLDKMNSYISQLVDRKQSHQENQLLATIDMVKNMTQIFHYKNAIEEDDTKLDVYNRLVGTLNTEFFNEQGEFSIFEVSTSGDELHPVPHSRNADASCHWCQQKILSSPKSCRVFHTARMVNGLVQPNACYSFKHDVIDLADNGEILPVAVNNDDDKKREEMQRCYPLCFPFLKSGAVGSIVQMVVKEADKDHILAALPYIKVYMADTAPALEVRRLMETLRESSLRDALTGLNNRRFLEEYIDTLTANTRRKQTHVAILMLDLDHFKIINDTYGHDTGDAMLKALANAIKATVRASDIVIRYGGEEFMVVLQDTLNAHALNVAEKIRATVESMKISYRGTTLQRTISIGVADFPGDSNTFWQAVKFADVALYNAKEAGRNCVVHFTRDMWKAKQAVLDTAEL